MTDNEIKKALEHCKNQGLTSECTECVYKGEVKDCMGVLLKDALDLINRLEAENNKLTSLCTSKDVIINSQEAEIQRLKEIEYMYNDLCK